MNPKIESIASIIMDLNEKQLLSIYNYFAKKQSENYGKIMPMQEFNNISFKNNLILLNSVDKNFDVNHYYFYLNKTTNKYESNSSIRSCVESIVPYTDLAYFYENNLNDLNTLCKEDIISMVKTEFIYWASKFSKLPKEWLEKNTNINSIISNDWNQYIVNLTKNFKN